MPKEFMEAAEEVKMLLVQNQVSQKSLNEHRRCCDSLEHYLTERGCGFSDDAMVDWLSAIKQIKSKDTYIRYRRSAYRILHFMHTGRIGYKNSMFDHGAYQYFDSGRPYVLLPGYYKELYVSYMDDLNTRLSPDTAYHYRIPVSEFLGHLVGNDVSDIKDVDMLHLYGFWKFIQNKDISQDKHSKSCSAITDFMSYLDRLNPDIFPSCYLRFMTFANHSTDIPFLADEGLEDYERSEHPTYGLEQLKADYLAEISKRRLCAGLERTISPQIDHFFVFLELNHLAFSKEAVILWSSKVSRIAGLRNKLHKIYWLYEFSVYRTIGINNVFDSQGMIDDLPNWSRNILEACLTVKKRAGFEPSTIAHYKSNGARLFLYLDANGVHNCDQITPELLMDFHKQNHHSTAGAKNASSVKVKGILMFMAEENLIPYSYALTMTTCTAPEVRIPEVLNSEGISTIYEYRKHAKTPLELRNAAMVLLGLRMGFRGCDIVNLKLKDIDWKRQQISITQKKTGKPLTLPMPTEVANSLYLYLVNGRPAPSDDFRQFVFIKSVAPYNTLHPSVCKRALADALAGEGIQLKKWQGFHILRRTYATNLLKSSVKIDNITDALGHSGRNAVDKYLSADEKGMRACAIPFSTVGGNT